MFDSSSSHIDFQSSQTKNNTRMFTYLTPFEKPRVEISNKYLGGCEYQKPGKVNFSNFSIPKVFLKSTHQENGSRNESKANDPTKLLPTLDEHSKAAASHENAFGVREKRKASDFSLCDEGDSSSACSLEASNDPNFGFGNHEGNYDSPYFSDNEEETSEDMVEEETDLEENRVKRCYKNTKSHNLTARKRRGKFNKKLRTLKNLIPNCNCNKMDEASMLDDVIDYLKTLKLQLEILKMGREICMPLMMLPAHHMNMPMNAQHLMGFRPRVHFPIPQMSNGVTGNNNNNNRIPMFGFSNQLPVVPPMSTLNAPFMAAPTVGNFSTRPSPTSYGGNQNQQGRTCG